MEVVHNDDVEIQAGDGLLRLRNLMQQGKPVWRDGGKKVLDKHSPPLVILGHAVEPVDVRDLSDLEVPITRAIKEFTPLNRLGCKSWVSSWGTTGSSWRASRSSGTTRSSWTFTRITTGGWWAGGRLQSPESSWAIAFWGRRWWR